MKTLKLMFTLTALTLGFSSCNNDENKADGYGNFEATEITISSENTGKLIQFKVKEGNFLKKGTVVGYIDTIPLTIKKEGLIVQKEIIGSKSRGVLSKIKVQRSKLKTAAINKARTENLLKDKAGTQKQLDDINGIIDVIKNNIYSIEIHNSSVINELRAIDVQLKGIDDLLAKSKIQNPINGTVLTTYAEQSEITAFGKPLYKIADLSAMNLRVYISEIQLTSLKIGNTVTVKVDAVNGMKSYEGIISWIASEAEFTPKIIQTKKERVALVYAVKINVKNDGALKIGMPAEMWLHKN